jgi:hypothetical protein
LTFARALWLAGASAKADTPVFISFLIFAGFRVSVVFIQKIIFGFKRSAFSLQLSAKGFQFNNSLNTDS